MTKKLEFTVRGLNNLEPAAPGKRYEIADTHISGLRVRVGDAAVEHGRYKGKAAQISFVLLARFPPSSNPTRRTLGGYAQEFPELTLEAARAKAADWKAQISRGLDPSAELKREREEAAREKLAAELACYSVLRALDRYDAEKLVQLRTHKKTRSALDGPKGLLSSFSERDIKTLTRAEVAEVVRAKAVDAPISANRQLAYANAFFEWCVEEELLDQNPAANIRKPSNENERDRFHSVEELREIWDATDALGYPFKHLYRLSIVQPLRRQENAAIEVNSLDLGHDDDPTEGVWTLRAGATKNAKALRIPLSPLARAILIDAINDPARPKDLTDEDHPKESRYVFTTTGVTPVSGFAKAKARLDRLIAEARDKEAAKHGRAPVTVPHWTVHDLRTTFNTIACDELGIDAAVADRILNHVATATRSKVQRIYNRSELFEPRKRALNAWASYLEAEVIGRSADRVAVLRQKTAA
ncbi:integrase family protein [Sphingomonas colocasiae]|uniref:Integrase family protein n=1 Tax=Sphingomonas colocasiae TaxID=1848973 RepID=A0ABS7PIC5_9SPHN|nr:integrase family protein [Sphingomonas colocasiae]MBY8821051.1 integrase family protein [Sphingomonas colocasiae]